MCGASSSQKQIAQQQAANYQEFSNNAQAVFGDSSQIFKDLTSAFQPILSAGPNQDGYSEPEKAALRSEAITNAGNAYRNAATAAGERIAASGGGNSVLPAGSEAAVMGNIATAGAANTANALTNIDIQSKEIGRQNWLSSAGILAGAPNSFNSATNYGSMTTGSGSAAMTGATDVANANRAWVGDVMGVLGDAASIGSSFIPGMKSGKGGGGGFVDTGTGPAS